MSDSSELALRKALFTRLSGDATLSGLMGTGRIFDVPPRGQAFPYLLLEALGSRLLLSEPNEGMVHELRLAVLSRKPSRDEALSVIERISLLVMETPLALSGYHLVGLQISDMASRLLRDGRTFRAEINLRCVSEPAA